MTIDTAIRARLLTLSPVTAIASTRIYTNHLPQTPTLPAVVVRHIDQQEDLHLRGPIGVISARVQVDSFATTATGAMALDAAIHGNGFGDTATGLRGFVGVAGSVEIKVVRPAGVRQDFEPPEKDHFRVMRDYQIEFSE